jgi:drug/metabolite transporter (DMT)-like permease
MVMARNASEAVATASFITALSILPLSTVSAILQANPLIVTMGAALFLGEAVGWRRWAAIAVGFCGMLLILRPTTEGLDTGALLAVLAMILLAVRDLTTRAMPKQLSSLVLAAYAFATLILTGGIMMLFHAPVVPTPPEAGLMGLAIVSGAGAYYCITAAMRVGEVGAVTPFRYTRLVFGMLIGILIFGERPDAMTYVGAAVIIAAGLYTFARERKRRDAATLSEMPKAG